MMNYDTFLARVIDDGIAAATTDYADDAPKREGAIAGFQACRGCSPAALAHVLIAARVQADDALCAERDTPLAVISPTGLDAYWRARAFELEVEWVCNVVSAALHNSGEAPIIPPTARGLMKAADILGVAGGLG